MTRKLLVIAASTVRYPFRTTPYVFRDGKTTPEWENSPIWTSEFEIANLCHAAQPLYDDVVLVDYDGVAIVTEHGGELFVYIDGHNISDAAGLIVRRTEGAFDIARALTRILGINGAVLADSISRFSLGSNSKVPTTVERWVRGVGSTTVIASERAAQPQVLRHLPKDGSLIGKPIGGRNGVGVRTLSSTNEVRDYLDNNDSGIPVLLQPKETIHREYRVLMLHGALVQAAEKLAAPDTPANAAQGATFRAIPNTLAADLAQYCSERCATDGLLGIDVADIGGDLRVIEENYTPQWKALAAATEENIGWRILSSMQRP